MSIKRKFLICFLVVFFALGAIGIWTGLKVRSSQRAQVIRSIDSIATVENRRLADGFQATAGHLQADMSKSSVPAATQLAATSGSEPDRAALADALEAFSSGIGAVRAATIVDLSGAPLADTSQIGQNFEPSGYDQEGVDRAIASISQGSPYFITGAIRTPSDDRMVHVISIDNGGTIVGYLVAECELNSTRILIGRHEALGRTAEAHLVQRTEDGAQFISKLRFRQDAEFSLVVPKERTDTPAMLALNGPFKTYDNLVDYRDEPVIAAVRAVPNSTWGLVIKLDRSEAFANVDHVLRNGLIGFALAASFALLVGGGLFGTIVRRMRLVADSATHISEGRWESRVGDLSSDELGQLARSFDKMADALVADMARRAKAEYQLTHTSRHDQLTALPNRNMFEAELKRALIEQTAPGQTAVLFCDLDDFKTVNDDLGHSAGDSLLRDVSARLRAVVGNKHVLARFGGDEFVVVARNLSGEHEAIELAERMARTLSNSITVAGREIFVTTSVGVAISQPGTTGEALVRDADAAMYRAKEIGRNRVVVFDETIAARTTNRISMTTELRRAISHGGLTMALQPIVDLSTGTLHAYEALVRWNHEGREVDPSVFVTRATELDLAGALDRWVLEEACRWMRHIDSTTMAPRGWLHVNVTGTSLLDDGFSEDALGVLRLYNVHPSAICLEVIEDRFGGAPAALRNLATLRSEGMRVAIDDFGTGHSSLARLRDLPADAVKIDQAFVRDLIVDPTAHAITTSIVQLARLLGLEVIAEGIEHPDQSAALLAMDCRYGQGFFVGTPQPASVVVQRVGVS